MTRRARRPAREALTTPDRMYRDLAEVRRIASALGGDYRWTYTYGLTSGSPGDTTSSPVGESNPTLNTVASGPKGYARSQARRASALVEEALSALRAASTAVAKAGPPEPDQYEPSKTYPRTTTRAELAASYAAKARREGRGEGWGDG